jgi:hypothetical protein
VKPVETPAPETAKLAVSFLAGPMTLADDDEMVDATAPRWARSEEQVAMDRIVKAYHDKWLGAGKPGPWAALVKAKCVATYFAQPDRVGDLKGYVNKAAKLHKVSIRYGTAVTVTEAMVKRYPNLTPEHVGQEAVSFAVKDKIAQKRAAATPASPATPAGPATVK